MLRPPGVQWLSPDFAEPEKVDAQWYRGNWNRAMDGPASQLGRGLDKANRESEGQPENDRGDNDDSDPVYSFALEPCERCDPNAHHQAESGDRREIERAGNGE